MVLSKKAVRESYESGAKFYDLALKVYALVGIRKAFRVKTVDLLHLKPGDFVIELGCGTGMNFPLIIEQIGPEGRLIGIDISPNMLALCRKRIKSAKWENVELVQGDVSEYRLPVGVNGVLSTGVFGFIEEYDRVVRNLSEDLAPGGRFAIMDGKRPDRMPYWFFKLFVWASMPFGVTEEYFEKRVWESVQRYFKETSFESLYGGMLYISAGTAISVKPDEIK